LPIDQAKLTQKIAPHLKRVLVIDPSVAAQRLLCELLRSSGAGEIWGADSNARALKAAQTADPMLIFTELRGPNLDGLELTKQIRRSDLPCRQVPVIVVTSEATPSSIYASRDAGVHEFLRKPYTIRDVLRRLDAVTLQQRDWIEGIAYIGPDRRRFNSGDYSGPRKRRSDVASLHAPDAARLLQAMKIVHAAVLALETEPVQAQRALRAQAELVQQTAVKAADLPLASAAADFRNYLNMSGPAAMARSHIESHVRTLWSLLPAEMEAEALASRAAA
jgi:CheY-like chemotaxis protein